MSKTVDTHAKTLRMVQIAFLAALVAVLQVISMYVKIGAFPLSLVLIPIMLGGAMFGVGAGAFLGGVFGLVTLVAGIAGFDPATLELFQLNAFFTTVIALGKAIAAGALSALVFKLVRKISKKTPIPAAIVSAAVTPFVNTSLFCVGMVVFFGNSFAVLIPLIIVNFLFELCVNVIICPVLVGVLSGSRRFKSLF